MNRKTSLIGPLFQLKNFNKNSFQTDQLIYVDGGAQFKNDLGDGIVVGDGDSFNGEINHRHQTDKDYSDLKAALTHINPDSREIHLHGFLGGRRDHELFNLGEVYNHLFDSSVALAKFFGANHNLEVKIFNRGEHSFLHEGSFSILSFLPNQVSINGDCRYQLENHILNPISSHGLSNEAFGEIKLSLDKSLLILFN